jgi:RNA recognition motif-containing protein
VTESQLENEFRRFGRPSEIKVIRNDQKGNPLKNSCFAFLNMETPEEAENAIRTFAGSQWKVSYRNQNAQGGAQ